MILKNNHILKILLAVFLLSACDKNTPTNIQNFDFNSLEYTISPNEIVNPSYIIKDKDSLSASQTLARRFINPKFNEDQVTLLGVQHVGSSEYYQQIQTILDEADVVLHEWQIEDILMMRELSKVINSIDKNCHIISFGNLSNQPQALNYSNPHFKHADASFEDIVRAIETHPSMPKSSIQAVRELLSSPAWMQDFSSGFEKWFNGLTIDAKARVIAHVKAQIYLLTDNLEPSQWFSDVIVGWRNKLALTALREYKTNSPLTHTVILYGAGHMDHMERCLKAMGYVFQQDTWLTVSKEGELPSYAKFPTGPTDAAPVLMHTSIAGTLLSIPQFMHSLSRLAPLLFNPHK